MLVLVFLRSYQLCDSWCDIKQMLGWQELDHAVMGQALEGHNDICGMCSV